MGMLKRVIVGRGPVESAELIHFEEGCLRLLAFLLWRQFSLEVVAVDSVDEFGNPAEGEAVPPRRLENRVGACVHQRLLGVFFA